jgi:hypothetical protein
MLKTVWYYSLKFSILNLWKDMTFQDMVSQELLAEEHLIEDFSVSSVSSV